MKRALKIVIPILLVAVLLTGAFWYSLHYNRDLTASWLISMADDAVEGERYATAVRYYEWAYELEDKSPEVALRISDCYKNSGNYTKAEYTLVKAIADHPTKELYLQLSRLYLEQDKVLDAVNMLDKIADPGIRAELEAMRPAAPTISREPGFDNNYITVSLTCETGTLYCTAAATYPSVETDLYSEDITLGLGETTISAVAIGENGLASPLARFGYTVGGVIETVTIEDAALDAAMENYADVNWNEPLNALSMLEFFDEIHTLVKNAASFGVPYCIPTVSEHRQYIARDLYNVVLLSKHGNTIVPNDVQFTESDPFFFLIGANSGGKTTYLRTVGMNLLLFLAGCPIFARDAIIYPFNALLTHFPADERFNGTGRLDEELIRANQMLADPDAFLLFNETFSGTDDTRGYALLMQMAKAIRTTGQFGLYVTHFHKVKESEFPLLTTQVDIEDANRRTYRIARADGGVSSYAADILRKYRLDRKSLDERRKRNGTQSVVPE